MMRKAVAQRRAHRRKLGGEKGHKNEIVFEGKMLRRSVAIIAMMILFYYCYNFSPDGALTTVHMSFRQKAGDTYWMVRSLYSRFSTRSNDEEKRKSPLDAFSARTKCLPQSSQLVMHLKVPKAASTTMFDLIYALRQERNKFAIDSRPLYVSLDRPDRSRREYAKYLSSFRVPTVRTAHCPYIDFARFDQPRPAYFGLVREPSARLRSHYDYVHWGPRSAWAKFWKGQDMNAPTFDDCLYQSSSFEDIIYKRGSCLFWANAQLAYYCGIDCLSTRITTELKYAQNAYDKAMVNVERDFIMVGLVERFSDALLVLENVLPYYFHGVSKRASSLKASRANTNQVHHFSSNTSVLSKSHRANISSFNVSTYLRHRILPFEYRFYHRLSALFDLQFKACSSKIRENKEALASATENDLDLPHRYKRKEKKNKSQIIKMKRRIEEKRKQRKGHEDVRKRKEKKKLKRRSR